MLKEVNPDETKIETHESIPMGIYRLVSAFHFQ